MTTEDHLGFMKYRFLVQDVKKKIFFPLLCDLYANVGIEVEMQEEGTKNDKTTKSSGSMSLPFLSSLPKFPSYDIQTGFIWSEHVTMKLLKPARECTCPFTKESAPIIQMIEERLAVRQQPQNDDQVQKMFTFHSFYEPFTSWSAFLRNVRILAHDERVTRFYEGVRCAIFIFRELYAVWITEKGLQNVILPCFDLDEGFKETRSFPLIREWQEKFLRWKQNPTVPARFLWK